MPIVIALVLLWIGSLLDMASTYYVMSPSIIGDDIRVREVNQHLINSDGDLLLVNLFTFNGVFLFVCSLVTIFALKNRNMVKKYIRETRYFAAVKDDLILSNKELRKEDFVSRKVIISVKILVLVGSFGVARFLISINNLMEYYVQSGFMSLFLRTFPTMHEQLALITVFCIISTVMSPVTYLLFRLSAR